jgi:hypothetical protein
MAIVSITITIKVWLTILRNYNFVLNFIVIINVIKEQVNLISLWF